MSNIYYHNPRCSKSRQGLELLEKKGTKFTIKEYLKEGLTKKEVKELIDLLNIAPADGLVRLKEKVITEENIGKDHTKSEWIDLLVKYPVLLERPILKKSKSAIIGRPPENLIK